MYAVIKTGGKQYKVQEGDVLKVEKLEGAPGEEIVFDEVLLVRKDDAPIIGAPKVENASVTAKIKAQDKHKKIVVFHKRRRKSSQKKTGHRQPFTELTITKINA